MLRPKYETPTTIINWWLITINISIMSIENRTYKDLSYSLFANPMSGDVGKKVGASAVKGAILSILKTNYNERLFDPEFGSDIRGSCSSQ